MSKVNEIKIGPQPGPQTKFLSTTADICIYGGSAGAGKGIRKTGLVLTPFGFTEIQHLSVGSNICATDGTIQQIIGYYPRGIQQFYKITFSDGSIVECDEEHLWVAWKAGKSFKRDNERLFGLDSAKKWTTKQIYDFFHNREGRSRKLGIPVVSAPVKFNVAGQKRGRNRFIKREIDPYTLGVLLGDGCITHKTLPQFYSADPEINDRVALSHSTRYFPDKRGQQGGCYFLDDSTEFKNKLDDLGLLGTYSDTKFIPRIYLLSSVQERIALLQGLMDTDGYVDEEGDLYYCSASKQLAEDFVHLVKSLGAQVGTWVKKTHYKDIDGNRIDCKDSHNIRFKLPDNSIAFHLERKKSRARGKEHQTLCNWIESIEQIDKDFSVCISVSHPNSLFITNDFIVTHNTASLIIEPLRHLENQQFSAVIFRRTSPQILNPGGLWDESMKFYNQLGGVPSVSTLTWKFPSGMRVKFAHLEHEKDKYDWQGSQIPLIMFDEITHITEGQFTYMMSRNRSDSGVPGYIRGTCNPDPQSWVRRWIDWYIGEDGLPIQSRSGVLRYFLRINDEMVWASNKDELCLKYGETQRPFIKSFTFIAATIYDNKILLQKDPNYLASLMSLPRIERERLLGGNWDVTAQGSKYFSREWTPVVPFPSCRLTKVRYWDRAASEPSETNPTPDWSVGTLFGKDNLTGVLYILDVVRFQGSPFEVKRRIRETQKKDGYDVRTIIEQDPGGAGKTEAFMLRRELAEGGYEVRCRPVTKDKLTRFLPFSAAAEHGDIKVVQGPWNEPFFLELERFQGDGKGKDDQVDTCSGGYAELMNKLESPIFDLGSVTKTHSFQIV